MIQRIQTLFLLGAIAILLVSGLSLDFFEYITASGIYTFDGYGITKLTHDRAVIISQTSLPVFVALLLLAAFSIMIVFSFKKLDQQIRQTKLLWGFYVVTLIAIIVWRYFIALNQVSGEILDHYFSYGFYLLVIGLPCVQMAFTFMQKDKNKIDSIDRIR